MAFHKITLKVNGAIEQVNVPSQMTLLQMLREELALTGTKNGCTAGECGACTVLMNGEPVNSCLVLAAECEGAEITTIEGLAVDGQLDVVQQMIIDTGGYSAVFVPRVCYHDPQSSHRNPHPTELEIRDTLSGNLCRCTGYARIIELVQKAADAQTLSAAKI